jgi:hypothetical protein
MRQRIDYTDPNYYWKTEMSRQKERREQEAEENYKKDLEEINRRQYGE